MNGGDTSIRQVDPGTFSGRQNARVPTHPVMWVHRNEDADVEYWVLYRPGNEAAGFLRVHSAAATLEWDLSFIEQKDHTAESFRNWVAWWYIDHNVEMGKGYLESYEYRPDGNGDASIYQGLFDTGAYAVTQPNGGHGGVEVAWVLRESPIRAKEFWLLRTDATPYRMPHGVNYAYAQFGFTPLPSIHTEAALSAHATTQAGANGFVPHPGNIFRKP